MLEELWTKVHNIVQEVMTKNTPKKRKCKKVVVCGGLPNSQKIREAKDKEERERHNQLNAEFQRIARRDKITFLSEQWKDRGKQ